MRHAMTWANADALLMESPGIIFSKIWIKLRISSFNKIHLKPILQNFAGRCVAASLFVPDIYYVHSCSKVMGFFFAVAKYGIYF